LTHYYREISTHRYNENERYLDAAVSLQLHRLSALDQKLQNVTARDSYVGSDKAVDNLTSRLDDLESQRGLAYASLVSDSAQSLVAESPSPALKKVIQHEVLQGDPLYNNLRDADAKDAAALAIDMSSYTSRYPGRPGEIAKVNAESGELALQRANALNSTDAFSPTEAATVAEQQKVAAIVAGDRARVAAFDGLIADTHRRLDDIPRNGADITSLRMQRDAAQAEYVGLSNRRAAAVADRAEAASLGSVVVIDRAVRASAQVGGGSSRLALIVSILILACALGSAFLVDAIDPRLRRGDQVETLYGQPLITTLKRV
jgi:hypothetical protein